MRFTGFVAKVVAIVVLLSSFVLMPSPKLSNAYIGWAGAGGSPYVGSAATQPADILPSDVYSISTTPSLALDSHGYPCVAWNIYTSDNFEVCFARWNGAQWTDASGATLTAANGNVSNNAYNSVRPKLVIDSNDNPCLAWYDASATPGSFEIYFARWDGTGWVNASGTALTATNGNMSNNSGDSLFPSLALDSSNNPCIAWHDNTSGNYEICYAKWNGSNWMTVAGSMLSATNGNMSNNTGSSMNPSLALDAAGNPCIAWHDNTPGNYEIYYSKWNGTSWVNISGTALTPANANLSNNAGTSNSPSLVLDSSQNPNIAWKDNTPGNNEIYFAKWNGSNWVTISGAVLTTVNGNISNNAGESSSPSLKLDSYGHQCIAWFDNTPGNYEDYYAQWNGLTWTDAAGNALTASNVNMSTNSGNSLEPSLALDSGNNPNLAWSDTSVGGNKIFFAKFSANFDGTFTITKSVDTNNDGDYSDSGKNVSAGDTLRYKINWKFNSGQDALENPYLYDTVPDGTTYVSGSASPTANISYSLDGGATWIAGEPPNGSPAGTQLRWDLSSLWVGAGGSPYVGSAATQPMDINVSRNTGTSQYCSIELDSNNYPNIAWRDNTTGNNEVFFVKWNGNNWVTANGTIFNPLTSNANVSNSNYDSSMPSMKLDSFNNPHIAWHEDGLGGNSEIVYVHWNGSNWVTASNNVYNPIAGNANISNNSGISWVPQIALDSKDKPHITWNDYSYATDREICYIHWDGNNWLTVDGSIYNPMTGNCNVSKNSSPSYVPVIDVDKLDIPHIAWFDGFTGNHEIFYVYSDGTNWRVVGGNLYNPTTGNANVSNNPGFSQYATIITDTNNFAHLSWADTSYGNCEILYVRWDGSNWVCADGSIYNAVTGNANVSRTPTDPNPFSVGHSMTIDKNNNPHIAWTDIDATNNLDLYYIHWNNGQWYNDQSNIYVPSPNNANVTKSPSSSINSGHVISIVTDTNNLPHMVFWDNYPSNLDILYIHLLSESRDFSFSVKIDNPATSYGICNHATFRHKWDNGVATESNEVCNTIKYNFTGTFTLDKGVDANGDGKYTDNGATVLPGTTLGYKLDWTFDNPNNDPLNGAYVYDTVPPGTKYVAGSSPTYNLSYSVDNGFSWHPGEPPDGSAAGTKLRWKIRQPGWTNAQGQLVNATNPNVSKNAGISDFPSCAVYKDGNPSIAWSDDVLGTTMVFYAKWNGTQWVNAAGLPFTAANGNVASLSGGDPSLALDPATGNPWIGFQSNGILFSNLEIHVVKWNGSQWTNASGTPATLINTDVSNNAGLSWFPSQLVLDSKGYPCIVWKDNTTGSFQNYFARWNGTNWVNASGTILNTTNGSMNNNVVNSFWPTISLDPNDRPYVAWDNNLGTNFEIYFAKWDGTQWVTASGTPLTPTNGNISNNAGSSQIPFLFTDRLTGNPCIAWSDDTPGNYEIYYAKWNGSGWVNASGTAIDTANPNMSHTTGGSYLLSLALDFNNLPAISWEDDTPGNSDIYYSIWNGSGWVNAKGDALTQTNGIVNTSPARSWFPSLAFDPVTNNPNIAWLDKTPGNNEVYFARWTDFSQTFTFTVKVDKPFTVPALSPICNSASFEHAFDGGNPLLSNSVCVKVKGSSEVKGANLVVRKTAKSIQYNPDDTFEFQITVANNGSTAAENVVLMDNFPHELAFASSLPSGQVGYSSVKFAVGTLAPNASAIFSLKFKLSPKTTIDDCITVINEAIATSGTLIAKDSAAINICTPKAPCELYIDTKWTNVVKGVRSKGEPVKLEVIPRCGSSPYSVKVEWGDGAIVTSTVEGEGESFITEHSYAETGEFTVKITCVDAYGSTRILTKTLK